MKFFMGFNNRDFSDAEKAFLYRNRNVSCAKTGIRYFLCLCLRFLSLKTSKELFSMFVLSAQRDGEVRKSGLDCWSRKSSQKWKSSNNRAFFTFCFLKTFCVRNKRLCTLLVIFIQKISNVCACIVHLLPYLQQAAACFRINFGF